MRIVVDADIWNAHSLFAPFGEVIILPGRDISPRDVRTADALIVRSVTRVNEALLADSSIRFVGTATSGIDHVDRAYLERGGITLAVAAGSNARPVVEYVVSSLFEWKRRMGRPFRGSTLGVIGRGRIGGGVADWGLALGMNVVAVDPPLARAGERGLRSLDEALASADVLTLHVPLEIAGPDATLGLIDSRRLGQTKRDAWIISASRGGVLVDADLVKALEARRLGAAILDVWELEPMVSQDLLRLATLMTPHIAGYSAAAHRRAAEFIAASLSQWLNGSPVSPIDQSESAPIFRSTLAAMSSFCDSDLTIMEGAVRTACDVAAIDDEYRQMMKTTSPIAAFDAIRAKCRARSELTDVQSGCLALSIEAHAVFGAWIASCDDRPRLG